MFILRKHFCGIFFIIFFIYALFSAVFVINKAAKDVASPSYKDILNGDWAMQFESKFNPKLIHYDISLLFWGAVNYFIFDEGKDGVVIGDDGWLFTKEEFEYYKNFTKEFEQKKNYIKKVNSILESKNIGLYVVLIPAKRRVYGEFVDDKFYNSQIDNLYEDFKTALDKEGIKTISILDVFKKYKNAYPDRFLFLKTDTHWSVKGADLAALEIAEEIDANHGDITNQSEYEIKENKIEYEGDLTDYVPLGRFSPYPKEIIMKKTSYTTKQDIDDLFGDEKIDFALVGTSYSANKLWGFEESLKFYLGADILNMADEGQGPFTVMKDYLRSKEFKDIPPKVIIWEIPERYISVEYDLE